MKARTAIGTHRHQVIIQRPGTPAADGDGGYTSTWTDLGLPWHVSILPATARDLERIAAGTVISTATHIITGRYRAEVTVATRLLFAGRLFQITGVSDPEERHIETICVCVELIGQALVDDFAWTEPGWISEAPAWVQEGTF
jgi:SPP1 family predicted phage head-tail adaptor